MDLLLNIYDNKGEKVIKTFRSDTYDLMFGTISSIMELLKIEDSNSNTEILKSILSVWNEIKAVLSNVFPGVDEEDWEHVKVKELVPIIINIGMFAISEALGIPSNSKN